MNDAWKWWWTIWKPKPKSLRERAREAAASILEQELRAKEEARRQADEIRNADAQVVLDRMAGAGILKDEPYVATVVWYRIPRVAVVIEGIEFIINGTELAVLVPCQRCGQTVEAAPVDSLEAVGLLLERPGRMCKDCAREVCPL